MTYTDEEQKELKKCLAKINEASRKMSEYDEDPDTAELISTEDYLDIVSVNVEKMTEIISPETL
jgi:hypothetical protein